MTTGANMQILQLLAGAAMLLLGRRLFWIFVGAAGLVFGIHVATYIFGGKPEWLVLLIAAGGGVLGALFAILLQRLAIGIAGFILGGYALGGILYELGWRSPHYHWLIFLAGGIIGVFLVQVVFDWALIFLSSVSGAVLIIQPFHPGMVAKRLAFFVLIIVGMAVQAEMMRKSPARPSRR